MYVAILSSALDEWVTDLRGPDLIEYALLCREELRVVSAPRRVSAYTALAAEIAYDRALIALCTERGIDAHATSFCYPRAERQRIERLLRRVGVDLDRSLAPGNRITMPSAARKEDSPGSPGQDAIPAEDRRATVRSPELENPEAAAAPVDANELPRAGVADGDQ